MTKTPDPGQLHMIVLDWYDRARRRLPWRAEPGAVADPYRVWLSEVMLQQTTVAAVVPYFEAFTARWPTVEELARAPRDQVLAAWAGLGYYARARNLHDCAALVADRHQGRFPSDETALRALPGIGPYTAAAIAAIAFDHPVVPVDGNVERVMARLFDVTEPLPGAKTALRALARTLASPHRPGDLAQALMDLGATVCAPKSPACGGCPLAASCLARSNGRAAELPRRTDKAVRPTRHGTVFWLERNDGAVLLVRRPDRGLLGGMLGLPGGPWTEEPAWDDELAGAPMEGIAWTPLTAHVRHTFTHFHLLLRVMAGRVAKEKAPDGLWTAVEDLDVSALPTVMAKAVRLALKR